MNPRPRRCLVLLAFALAACKEAGAGSAKERGAAPPSSAVRPAASARSAEGAGSRCPAEMAWVEGVCIDRYEAHLVTLASDGKDIPHPAYLRPPKDGFARSRAGVRPQAYISRVEASAACARSGKRLCALKEWYRACRGPANTTYPYGRRFQRGRCNVGKPHLLSILHGANPNGWRYEAHFNDPRLGQEPGYLVPCGEFAGCVSGYGVYDLVGNLHEWVADRVDRTLPSKLPLRSQIRRRVGATTGNGIFMGGFFSTMSEHGNGCDFVTAAHEPAYHDYSTGFRCCRDASE